MKKEMITLTLTTLILSTIISVVQPAYAYTALSVSSSTVPANLGPGDSGNLILTISNGGTSYARDIELTISSNSYIAFNSKKYDIGTIAASGSTQISVPITVASSLPVSSTSVFMTLEYNDGDTSAKTTSAASIPITFISRSIVQIEEVSWGEDILSPGDTVDVNITIRNAGSDKMKDVTVKFGNESLPFVSANGDTEVYIGDLNAKMSKTASFSLILNKNTQTVAYQVPVTIDYYDETSTALSDLKYVGMKISGTPEFIVTLEKDNEAISGKEGEITFSIANRGTSSANLLTLSFDSGLETTPTEYYVGDMDPDDYETITIELDLTKIPVGKKDMVINMLYRDSYNQDVTESKTISFTVKALPESTISMTTILLVVAVLGGVIYWKRESIKKILGKNR